MPRLPARRSVVLMTRSDHDHRDPRRRRTAASAVVWNTVIPALGVALILGASLLPAIAIAGVASVVIHAVLAGETRRGQWRRRVVAHVAPHRLVRGN